MNGVPWCHLCGEHEHTCAEREHTCAEHEGEDLQAGGFPPKDPKSMTVATEPAYDARVWVDGDETHAHRIYVDDSYFIGENLNDIAWRQAYNIMRSLKTRYGRYDVAEVRVALHPLPPRNYSAWRFRGLVSSLDDDDSSDLEPAGEGVAY